MNRVVAVAQPFVALLAAQHGESSRFQPPDGGLAAFNRVDVGCHVRFQRQSDGGAPAGPQDAVELGERGRRVEPVERLRRHDGVRGRRPEAGGLCAALAVLGRVRARGPRFRARLGAHVRGGLEADDAQPARRELPRRDPGAAADVDEHGAGPEAAAPEDEVDRGVRVRRPEPRVRVGQAAEAAGRIPFSGHGPPEAAVRLEPSGRWGAEDDGAGGLSRCRWPGRTPSGEGGTPGRARPGPRPRGAGRSCSPRTSA